MGIAQPERLNVRTLAQIDWAISTKIRRLFRSDGFLGIVQVMNTYFRLLRQNESAHLILRSRVSKLSTRSGLVPLWGHHIAKLFAQPDPDGHDRVGIGYYGGRPRRVCVYCLGSGCSMASLGKMASPIPAGISRIDFRLRKALDSALVDRELIALRKFLHSRTRVLHCSPHRFELMIQSSFWRNARSSREHSVHWVRILRTFYHPIPDLRQTALSAPMPKPTMEIMRACESCGGIGYHL